MSAPEFKVGDRVRRIGPPTFGIQRGGALAYSCTPALVLAAFAGLAWFCTWGGR